MFHTGGNPDEGKCSYVLMEHATEMRNDIDMECPYDSNCRIGFYFGPAASSNDISDCGVYEYKFVQNENIMKIRLNSSVKLTLDSDEHVRFSLFDIKNVEKKYDFDLSGIIHSFNVRGDSVDVNVMKDCRMDLFSCNKKTVYGNNLLNGKYSFSITDGCKDHYSIDCSWEKMDSLGTDNIELFATIYWK
jgi:hypothetical protein